MSKIDIDKEIQTEGSLAADVSLEKPLNAEMTESGGQAVLFRRALWFMWWVGTVLIVLSWFRFVSNTVGWIGFAAALASSFISVMSNKYWRIPR